MQRTKPYEQLLAELEATRNELARMKQSDRIEQPWPDYRASFEAAPNPYLLLTPEMTIAGVNDAYLRATMTARENLVGRSLFEVFPVNPDDATPPGARSLPGSLLQVIAERNEALETANEELEAQTDLLLSQVALTTDIVENAPAGISYLNRRLVYEWVNPTQLRMWKLGRDQVIGRSIRDVFGASGEAQVGEQLRAVIATGTPYRREAFPFCYLVEGETRTTYWDLTYQPVRNACGEVQGVMVFAIEVSDRVEKVRLQAERIQALQVADRMKDQFLGILSHELRTPINAIMGFASILNDEVAGPLRAEQHQYLEKVLGGAEVLLTLINDLLDLSRIQAGKFTMAPEPVEFTAIAHEVVAYLAPLAAKKQLRLETRLEDGPFELIADSQRLQQVLVNLVGNAIKFTPEGGAIALNARRHGKGLRVEVTDSGVGIAEEDLCRLFKPFSQLDMSKTRRVTGTGLGLSIVKALVEAHGGEVGVQSQPDHGSTFWFALPLTSAVVDANDPASG